MDKLREISPWIDDVIYDFSRHIFSDYNTEILEYFHGQINREIRIINANPDEYRATALFTTLRDLYHHYTFKIASSGKDCPNVRRSCVILLSQLIKVGLILSKGNIDSLWINRILTATSLFTGKPSLVNEALFLVNNLKFKYHKAYFEILKHVLTSENKEYITEPLMYMEVILLYRRLKAITKSGYHRSCVTSLAAKIKPPVDLITWLYSLVGNQEFKSDLKYVTISKQLMRNKISERLIRKVREIVFSKYAFQTSVAESCTLKSIEQTNSFVIDSSPIVDSYKNSDKFDPVSRKQRISDITVKKSKMSSILFPFASSAGEETSFVNDAVASVELIKGKKKKRKSSNDINSASVSSKKKKILPEGDSSKNFKDLKVNIESLEKKVVASNTGLQNKIYKSCSENYAKEEFCKNISSKRYSSSFINNTSVDRFIFKTKNKNLASGDIKVIEINSSSSEDNLTLPISIISKNTSMEERAVKLSEDDSVECLEESYIPHGHKNEPAASNTLSFENNVDNHDSSPVCDTVSKSSLHAKLICQGMDKTNVYLYSELNIETLPNDKFVSSQLLNEHASIQNQDEICAHIPLSHDSSSKNLDISVLNSSSLEDAKSAESLKKTDLKRKHSTDSNYAYSSENKRPFNSESLSLKPVKPYVKSDSNEQSLLLDTLEESKENSLNKTKIVKLPTYSVSSPVKTTEKLEMNESERSVKDKILSTGKYTSTLYICKESICEVNDSESKTLNIDGTNVEYVNESKACVINSRISDFNEDSEKQTSNTDGLSLETKCLNESEIFTNNLISEVNDHPENKTVIIVSENDECINKSETCIANSKSSHIDNVECKASYNDDVHDKFIKEPETFISISANQQFNENSESKSLNVNVYSICMDESTVCVTNNEINSTNNDSKRKLISSDDLNTKCINEEGMHLTNYVINEVISNLISKIVNIDSIHAECMNDVEACVTNTGISEVNDDLECKTSNTDGICTKFFNESNTCTTDNLIGEINILEKETVSIHSTDTESINESNTCTTDNFNREINNLEKETVSIHSTDTECINESRSYITNSRVNDVNVDPECKTSNTEDLCTKFINESETYITDHTISQVNSNLESKTVNIGNIPVECNNESGTCVTINGICDVDQKCKISNIGNLCAKFINESEAYAIGDSISEINTNTETLSIDAECINESASYVTNSGVRKVNDDLECKTSNTDDLCTKFIDESETCVVNNLIGEVNSNIEHKTVNVDNVHVECINEPETCVTNCEISDINDDKKIETSSIDYISTECITESHKEPNILVKNILKEMVIKVDSAFNNTQKESLKVIYSECTDEISQKLSESNNIACELHETVNETQEVLPKVEAVSKHIEEITLEAESKGILSNFSSSGINKTYDSVVSNSSISEDICADHIHVTSSIKSNDMGSPCEKPKHLIKYSSNEYIDILTVSNDSENFQKLHCSKDCTIKEACVNLDFKTLTTKEINPSCSKQFIKILDHGNKDLKSSNYVQFPHSSENKNYLTFSDISMINKETGVVNSDLKSPNQIRNFAFAATAEIFSSYRNDSLSGDDKLSSVTILKDDLSYCQELSNDGKSQNMSSDGSYYRSDSEHSIGEVNDQYEEENVLENLVEVSSTSDNSVRKNECSNVNEVQVDADTIKLQLLSDNEERELVDKNSPVLILESDNIEETTLNETNKSRYSLRQKIKDKTVLEGEILPYVSKKNDEKECDISETSVNLREDSESEKNFPVHDDLRGTNPICLVEDIFSLSQSSCSLIKNPPKMSSFKRNTSKQSGMPPRRYSLRQQKSKLKTDDSSKLEIDLSQLHLDSPSSRKTPNESSNKNQMLIVKLLDLEYNLPKENIEKSDLTLSCKRETRSSVAKSSIEESIPNTPGYNLRNRKSIITPAKLKIKL